MSEMKINRKKVIQYSSLIIGTVIFIAVLNIIGIKDVISSLRMVHPLSFFFYLTVSVCIFMVFVLRWYIILKCHGHAIDIRKLFNYRVAAHAIGYLTPSARLGGEPVRVHYLIKKGVSPEKATSSVVIDKSVELTANGVMTIMGAILFAFMFVLTGAMKVFLIVVVIGMLSLIWLFYYRLFRGKGVFSSMMESVGLTRLKYFHKKIPAIRRSEREMTDFFIRHRRVFIASTAISFVAWVLSILEYKLLLYAFGYTATYTQVFFVLVVVGFSYMMPIPAALGVLEGMQATLFTTLGKGARYGIAVSLVTRVRDTMWALYGLIYIYTTGLVVRNILKNENMKPKLSKRAEYFRKWKPRHNDD